MSTKTCSKLEINSAMSRSDNLNKITVLFYDANSGVHPSYYGHSCSLYVASCTGGNAAS